MDERQHDSLEQRARMLFRDSVENVDMRVRSRLTQARHAALEAAGRDPAGLMRKQWWIPAAGVTAAAVLGAVLWIGTLSLPDAQSNLEDLDIVAASDDSGVPLEMLQDDLDFYDFADKAANMEPAA